MLVTDAVRQFWRVVPRELRTRTISLMRQGIPLPPAAMLATVLSAIERGDVSIAEIKPA